MLDNTIKFSPHGSFKLSQVCRSVALCEATNGDRHPPTPLKGDDVVSPERGDLEGWGNATDTEPAFIAYLGCQKDEVAGYVKTLNTFYRCYWCEVRKPRHLKEFEAEIKIRGMQRYSDPHAFGLDYLIESQQAKHFGADYDEYNQYATGYMPRW